MRAQKREEPAPDVHAFFSELELSVKGKDRGLTEGQTMHLYERKAVQILSVVWGLTRQQMTCDARDQT